MARVTRGRRAFARPQRKRVWASQSTIVSGITSSAPGFTSPISQFRTDYDGDLVGATIARTHYAFRATQTAGATLLDVAGGLLVGLIVGREGDTPADLGPLDAASRHLDWMLVRPVFPTEVIPGEVNGYLHQEGDLKAMRKLEELGQNYYAVFQALVGAQTWQVEWYSRTLLLLP